VHTTSPSRPDLASHLRLAIARMGRRLRQQAPDLSPSQTAALATIEKHGPLTPSELATRERVQRPSITRMLAFLEGSGLVVRAADPTDRRSSLVTISAEGAALLEAGRVRKDAYLARRLERLSAEDLATLDRAADLLERLLEEDGEQ
jgi:DNA-binding MarR family transcriptional regulator